MVTHAFESRITGTSSALFAAHARGTARGRRAGAGAGRRAWFPAGGAPRLLHELSQGNRVRLDPIPASRGLIFDRNGKVMADNEPAYQLELVREQVPDLNDTLKRLAALGLIDRDDLEDTRRMIFSRRSFDTVPVRLRLTDEESAASRCIASSSRAWIWPPARRASIRGPARRARARLRRRHQRAGPQAHRPRRLRRHLADRQARGRERLRARLHGTNGFARCW